MEKVITFDWSEITVEELFELVKGGAEIEVDGDRKVVVVKYRF